MKKSGLNESFQNAIVLEITNLVWFDDYFILDRVPKNRTETQKEGGQTLK